MSALLCRSHGRRGRSGRSSRRVIVLLLALLGAQVVAAPLARAAGTLAVKDLTVAEPADGVRTATFTVSLTGRDGNLVTVGYATADGTAAAGADYVSTSGSLDFGNSATTRTVTVTILADGLDEADETFSLNLTGASEAAPASLSATATIADSDPTPTLSIGDATVVEGDSGPTTASFAVSLSAPSVRTVTVDYTSADGTATSPVDYSLSPGTLTFGPGEQTKTIPVPVAGDVVDEATETFTVTLANPNANATIPGPAGTDSGTGTIVDDDGAPALSVDDAGITEGSGDKTLTFHVTLDRPSATDVTFRAQTADGIGPAGARESADYTKLASTPTTIPAGKTSVDVGVTVKGDGTHEPTETFTVLLSAPTNATVARAAGTGTITDDDAGPDLSVADTSVTEGNLVGSSLTFTVTLSVPAAATISVNYATADGSATAPADYTAVKGTLNFAAGQTTKTVTVSVVHDTFAEGTETLKLELSNPTGAGAISRAAATGTIDNDDGLPDELSITDAGPFDEGDSGTAGHLFLVTRRILSDPTLRVVTVNYATADGSATAGSDYAARTGTLTFAGGSGAMACAGDLAHQCMTQGVTASVDGDTVYEDDETFTVALSGETNAVLTRGTGTARITNDDPLPELSAAPVTAVEGNSNTSPGAVTVTLSALSSKTVTVGYDVGGGTATAFDYTPAHAGGTLSFPPGVTARTVPFAVTGDSLDEEDETFAVTLSNPANAAVASGVGTVTIADDDATPTLSVSDVALSETEARQNPAATFVVTLSAVSGRPATVAYRSVDGSGAGGSGVGGATAPGDYTATSGTLAVPAGARTASVAVTVNDDDETDSAPSETFTVVLSGAANAVIPGGTVAGTGTIRDNEGPLTVSVAGITVTEGSGSAGFVVSLSSEPGTAVSVNYATGAPETANGDLDYAGPATGTLTFKAGETSQSVDVGIVADSLTEADETFTLTLSTPVNCEIDPAAASALATIVDDDLPVAAGADLTVAEGNSGTAGAVFVVKLTPAPAKAATVAYATANGTATGGVDYTPTSGTLAFAPGDDTRTVTVPVAGDTGHEDDEDFFLSMSGATGATVATSQVRAVITDDDVSQLDIADAAVVEGDTGTTGLTFTVTFLAPAAGAVTVGYATGNGTATTGEDYTATTGALTFNPGDTTRTITVPVAGDTNDRTEETFTLTLSAQSAGARLGRSAATGTIIDDDAPPAIAAAGGRANEPTDAPGLLPILVRLSGPRPFPVRVHYETVPGTATAGVDYTPVAGDLIFAPAEESKAVAVALSGDRLDEADETVRVRLSNPVGGTITDGGAVATIVDDDPPGYLFAATDGGIFAYGGAGFFGSTGAMKLNSPIVGVAGHPSGRGYWLVASDGGIFSFGEARFSGSTGAMRLNRPIVGMAATPSGQGYWLVASDGGLFSFGDARFLGSTGALRLNRPIVGMAATPSGQGYWLVASDGGLFSFGDATFSGSTGALRLNRPIVGMAATPSGRGYWLVATDGGVFSFGDARFFGSTGALTLNRPIAGMAATPTGDGYRMVATDGGVFSFGHAPFLGSTGASKLNKPVVALM